MTSRKAATAALTVYEIEPHANVIVGVDEQEELVVVTGTGSIVTTDHDAQRDSIQTTHRQAVRQVLAFLDAAHSHGPASIQLGGDGVAIVVRIRHLLPPSHG